MKKIVIRAALLIAVVLLSLVLLFSGKGHTLLLDNKSITIGGMQHEPAGTVTVVIDNKKPVTLASGERDLVVVKGVHHAIKVTANGATTERKFSLPFKDMLILSIPAFLANNPVWFEDKQLEIKQPPAQNGTEETIPTPGETVPL